MMTGRPDYNDRMKTPDGDVTGYATSGTSKFTRDSAHNTKPCVGYGRGEINSHKIEKLRNEIANCERKLNDPRWNLSDREYDDLTRRNHHKTVLLEKLLRNR